MAAKDMVKLSFSFASKSSKPNSSKRPLPFSDPTATTTKPTGQFVTEFDPSQTLAAASSSVVIPPIPNSDFRLKKLKNLTLPDPAEKVVQQQFVVHNLDSNAQSDKISYGLTVRSNNKSSNDDENSNNKILQEEKDLTLKRFKEDIEKLPEDRGMDEFKDVAIEDFAAAVLAGYGWKEGKGIGRNAKEDTKVVQYDRRHVDKSGIGFDPNVHGVKKVRKGEGMVYVRNENSSVGSQGERKVVRVVSGRWMGRKGEILKELKGGEILVRLVDGGEEVRADEDMVCELGSEAEARFLQNLKDLEISDRKENKEGRREKDDDGNKRHRRREKDDDKRSYRRREKEDHRMDHSKREKGDGKRSYHRREKEDHRMDHGKREKSSPVKWLRSHIKVKVISKDFKRGKWYLKKGEVVDVVGPTVCDISMDEGGELVQGVNQDILETALPKRGGSVVVLYGRHKGVYGSLVEKDTESETGVVRDADGHNLISVRLEQIAEFVGDPSYLGY